MKAEESENCQKYYLKSCGICQLFALKVGSDLEVVLFFVV